MSRNKVPGRLRRSHAGRSQGDPQHKTVGQYHHPIDHEDALSRCHTTEKLLLLALVVGIVARGVIGDVDYLGQLRD